MEGVKKRPFKTAFYPLIYLVKDIYRFYNGFSPQYKIRIKNVISNYGPVKQRGYFNSDIINIYPYSGRGFYKVLYSVLRIPKGDY